MIKDSLSLTTRKITPEGFLQGVATITCVGVQDYSGAELQSGFEETLDPTRVYHVFRPRDTVFDSGTVQSAKMKPVTDGHPSDDVTTDNCRNLSIGTLGDSPVEVSDKSLAFPICITDPEAVQKIQDGTHQVSCGYNVNIAQKRGIHDGKPYDMIYHGPMIINHLALVEAGRCEEGARILDQKKGFLTMFKKKAKKMTAKIEDLDGNALISKLVEKISPQFEKLASTDDFVDKVVEKLAGALSVDTSISSDGDMPVSENSDLTDEDTSDIEPASDPAVEGDLELEDEGDNIVQKDGQLKAQFIKKMTDKLEKQAADKIETVELVKSLDAEYKYTGQSTKKMLSETLSKYTDQNLEGKSEDYLKALASILCDKRAKVADSFNKVKSSDSLLDVQDKAIATYENILGANVVKAKQSYLKQNYYKNAEAIERRMK
jgi:hypothetical protein